MRALAGIPEFLILGPLEARLDGRPVALRGAKQRALLAVLLLYPGQVLSVERLIDDLWGEAPPQTAANTLQVYVSQLRKTLGAGTLVTQAPGYVAQLAAGQLDATLFAGLVDQGRHALLSDDPETAGAGLREALALWRGDCLVELELHGSARSAIDQLEQLRLAVQEDIILVELSLGHHAALETTLEALVQKHPYRESLRAHLMLALYRSGRQADALEAYRRARLTLVDELGIEPGPELQQLQQAILCHDSSLELSPLADAFAAVPQVEYADRRKQIAVTFVDCASDPDDADPELLASVAGRCFALVAAAVERHGGVTRRLPSGRMMAVFGAGEAHEDDALRALRAAAEAREELAVLGDELAASVGIRLVPRAVVDTGLVLVGADGEVSGGVVVQTEQALEAAPGGAIVVGAAARALVAGAAELEPLDGDVFRLVELVPGAVGVARRLDSPLVGRGAELAEIEQALARAGDERCCVLVTVLGEAGIGKSRLALELRSRAEATVLYGACRSYGEGVTFAPLADALGGLPTDSSATTEETFRAVRREFERLAGERPLVVVLDDVHWAEPTLLDLVEHVAEWSRDAPILLLCLARPELLETRPDWCAERPNATTLALEPLSTMDCSALIAQLPGAELLSDEARARIADFAGGNPFAVEQLLALQAEDPRFAGHLASPPSIRALIGARIDRLTPDERTVLERASVLGVDLDAATLAELLPAAQRPLAGTLLESLAQKSLLRGREPAAYVFTHALVREAAYESLPKRLRAELHAEIAELLEAGDDELVGLHLEQAYVYRRELGLLDEHDAELAERGAERLAAAGRRAHAAGDIPAAVSLLTRAVKLYGRPATGAELGEALRDAGELAQAEATLVEAIEAGRALGDERAEAHASIVRWRMRLQLEPELSFDEAESSIRAVIERLQETDADALLAKAWHCLAWIPWLRGEGAVAQQALDQAIAYARSAGDTRTEAQILNFLVGVTLFGPTRVAVAIERCSAVLHEAQGEGRVAASALRALAGLHAMEGRFEEAWACVERDGAILRDLGLKVVVSSSTELAAIVGLLAGDPVAAESHLRRGRTILEEMGDRSALSANAAMLAEAVLAQGRDEEALELTAQSERAASAEDLPVQVEWRGARAKALARRGELDAAERLAREAVSLAERTDFLNLHGNALMDLATVLRQGRRLADAAAAAEAANALYERKGNLVSAEEARSFVGLVEATVKI
ncbi:MAG TPA: BTAD domain-containing putative transcriptional regulator [Gaiellaceae bacterium]|nr:BTAD domain-containing putative transcriptional regulator [Gaiellaceae bacterium]